jgi:threonine aldolase
VTLPSAEMMAAIGKAPLGDAARGDDPTVNELESLARELTGKDDALFVPSGTLANLSALLAHDCRGGEVIVEATSHIYNAEGSGLSIIAGAIARPIAGHFGALDPDDVRRAIRGGHDLGTPTRIVCIENTHNDSGGTVLSLANMAAIHDVARIRGVPVHLDGARLFNAAVYLDVPIRALCAHADSIFFAVCKGLRAPVGAVLAGDHAFMQKARRAAKMLGGGMRQAGVIAAPAIVALRDPYAMLHRDHALARRLAHGFAEIDGSLVDVERVQTNIVNCFVDAFTNDAAQVAQALDRRGVRANAKRSKIRFVTHSDVDDAAVDAAIGALAEAIASLPRRN